MTSFLDRLIPPRLRQNPELYIQARTLVVFSFSNTLFALPFVFFSLHYGYPVQAVQSIVFVLFASIGTLSLQWWSGNLRVPVHFLCGLQVAVSVLTALHMGGIHSASIAWLVTTPAFASLLLGKWAARLWALIVLTLILGLTLLDLPHPSDLPSPTHTLQSLNANSLLHLAVSLSVALSLPFMLRLGGSRERPSQLLSGQLTAACLFAVSLNGGTHSTALVPCLASIPLYLLLLCPDWVADLWSACCGLGLLLFGLFALLHPQLPPLQLAWIERASGSLYLSGILLFSLVGILFEMRRRKAVAEMQQALAALHAAHSQLIRLNREKDEFLSIVTHDLKSPLTTITGYTEIILEEIETHPEIAREWCGQILVSSKQMMNLITNLLNTHSIESGHADFRLEEADLREIANRAVDCHALSARRKNLELIREIPLLPARVHTDPQAAHHILDNLISNAVKYSPKEASPIRIRVREEDEWCLTEVCDSGPGISREDQARLFQKYTRLSARPTSGESSTGLGLSIAKRMTEKMGGTLTFVSTPGGGSTFTLRLPKKGSEAARNGNGIAV
ncbi:Signal transduction histidine kinase [Verrucomicrobium sp. GAS474]|uniref:sensor histidine kinase n=1 Tax=Verrucomicrobium sp. GAS474 TaxID=1882831 RepID=UPI00087B7577|nr:HAMP domain-containing sensor histidine kinase [Verrucomicrobium sp. GAS474]SDU20514.1 Signal transduction histidine kinase [Verrucomicrobium sp. GAS474]